MKTKKITKECYKRLIEEFNEIKKKTLPAIRAKIQEARRHGDFSENAELQSELKNKQLVEKRLTLIEGLILNSEVVENNDSINKETVQFGAKVSIKTTSTGEIKTYEIVGAYESNIREGKICYQSPLAKLLIGKKVEEYVELNSKTYKVIKIEYADFSS